MEAALAPLAGVLELNTDLLLNCLNGVSDEEARRLNRPLDNPLTAYLDKAQGIDDSTDWPSLDDVRAAWRAVSAHLLAALPAISARELATPDAHRFPFPDTTRLGMIAFLTQHDSYHLGQLAFLRRQLGKPAMAYTR